MHLGIDIGATKTLVGTFDSAGELTHTQKFKTFRDTRVFEHVLLNSCDELLEGRHPTSVGLGVPGLVMSDDTFASANLGWDNYDLNHTLQDRYYSKTFIDNDVNFAALAEARRGAAKDKKSAVYVSLSTGVGSAIIIDGNIPKNMRTSECGLMLMNPTEDSADSQIRLEDIASGTGFERQFHVSPEIADDAKIWEHYGKQLSVCLFNISVMFFPEVVVLGGGLMNQYSRFNETLNNGFEALFPEQCAVPALKAAHFINDGVLYGSYEAATDLN
jgi:fructokinase